MIADDDYRQLLHLIGQSQRQQENQQINKNGCFRFLSRCVQEHRCRSVGASRSLNQSLSLTFFKPKCTRPKTCRLSVERVTVESKRVTGFIFHYISEQFTLSSWPCRGTAKVKVREKEEDDDLFPQIDPRTFSVQINVNGTGLSGICMVENTDSSILTSL